MVCLGQVGHVDHGHHVDGKLQEDGKQDVKVQDRGQRSFLGQLLHGLEARHLVSMHPFANCPARNRIELTLAREMQ
jgi:hypothetical protein